MNKWYEPKLGQFTYNEGISAWIKDSQLEPFSMFSYNDCVNKGTSFDTPNQLVKLWIETDGEDDLPSEGVVDLIHLTLKNQEKLLAECLNALFNDFLGKGPSSGMWWRLEIDHIRALEALPKSYVLSEPRDLYKIMGDPGIVFQNRSGKYKMPCSTIGFESVFEKGHGVGFLTNGKELLGLGYRMDPFPYK